MTSRWIDIYFPFFLYASSHSKSIGIKSPLYVNKYIRVEVVGSNQSPCMFKILNIKINKKINPLMTYPLVHLFNERDSDSNIMWYSHSDDNELIIMVYLYIVCRLS